MIVVSLFFQEPQTSSQQADSRSSFPLKEKVGKLDLLSTAVFVPSIVSLLLALQWGGSRYGWGSARIIVLFAFCVVLVGLFAWLQWRSGDEALLPPRIMSQRSILSGMWFIFCNSSALSVIDYYVSAWVTFPRRTALNDLQMPTYFQVVKGVSASKSGILVLPTVVSLTISILFSGSAVSIVGYYAPFMMLTSILTPVATGLLTTLEVDAVLARLICYQALFGFGCGIGCKKPYLSALF